MLGSLTDEYAELLTRLAVKQEPLEMGQELHVGQPRLSLCKLGNSSESCALKRSGEKLSAVSSQAAVARQCMQSSAASQSLLISPVTSDEALCLFSSPLHAHTFLASASGAEPMAACALQYTAPKPAASTPEGPHLPAASTSCWLQNPRSALYDV